jgi:hypothetical protein
MDADRAVTGPTPTVPAQLDISGRTALVSGAGQLLVVDGGSSVAEERA